MFEWQALPASIDIYTDSDWAGCKSTCRSTSGGIVRWGKHCLKSWSSTQATVALSSAEAELYALTKGAAQALGIMTMLLDLGAEANATIHADASAAIGIVRRTGLGKLRHLNVRYLWLQDHLKGDNLKLTKVAGAENPSDLVTKHLSAAVAKGHLERLCMRTSSGRAATAPTVASVTTPVKILDLHTSVRPLCHTSPNALLWHVQDRSKLKENFEMHRTLTDQIAENRSKLRENFEMHRTLTNQIAAENLSSAHVRETAVLYQPGFPSPGVAHAERLEQFACADLSHAEEPESDKWLEGNTYCVRVHESSRNSLFTPPRVAGIQPRQALAAVRITEGRYIDDGEEFKIVDNWTGRSAHRVLQRRWTGSTTFLRVIGPDASGR